MSECSRIESKKKAYADTCEPMKIAKKDFILILEIIFNKKRYMKFVE
jgi:hypothetical protein